MLSLILAATLTMQSTAYDLRGPTTYGGYTHPAGLGIVATDPRVIPPGTRLYIPGYGPATAWDTGRLIKGNRIDVWLPTRKQALAWGRRTVQVTILEGGGQPVSRGEGFPAIHPNNGPGDQKQPVSRGPRRLIPTDPFSLDSLLGRTEGLFLTGGYRPP